MKHYQHLLLLALSCVAKPLLICTPAVLISLPPLIRAADGVDEEYHQALKEFRTQLIRSRSYEALVHQTDQAELNLKRYFAEIEEYHGDESDDEDLQHPRMEAFEQSQQAWVKLMSIQFRCLKLYVSLVRSSRLSAIEKNKIYDDFVEFAIKQRIRVLATSCYAPEDSPISDENYDEADFEDGEPIFRYPMSFLPGVTDKNILAAMRQYGSRQLELDRRQNLNGQTIEAHKGETINYYEIQLKIAFLQRSLAIIEAKPLLEETSCMEETLCEEKETLDMAMEQWVQAFSAYLEATIGLTSLQEGSVWGDFAAREIVYLVLEQLLILDRFFVLEGTQKTQEQRW